MAIWQKLTLKRFWRLRLLIVKQAFIQNKQNNHDWG
nr:MAG TPA: hypothetical protein [Caudoviricetes sp.]DAW36358.1 MAG TPA: hypothetical protein [Caudoviricetes sp.]